MDEIHFQAEVGSDNTIHVPEGITLPAGTLMVTIVPGATPSKRESPGTWKWLREMAKEAERINPDLPADMAANHDYYAHGKPRE